MSGQADHADTPQVAVILVTLKRRDRATIPVQCTSLREARLVVHRLIENLGGNQNDHSFASEMEPSNTDYLEIAGAQIRLEENSA